jgi:hypothetical protein
MKQNLKKRGTDLFKNLKQVRIQLANYKRFRRLTDQWIGSAPKLARSELEK